MAIYAPTASSPMCIPRKYVPPTENRYINTAPIITGKIASPLVFNACPYTRFVTLPNSRNISTINNFTTSSIICVSSVNICTIKCPDTANVTEKHVAVIRPYITAFLVPLSHSSNSFAPILQPVIIALACARAAPTQYEKFAICIAYERAVTFIPSASI